MGHLLNIKKARRRKTNSYLGFHFATTPHYREPENPLLDLMGNSTYSQSCGEIRGGMEL